MKPLPSRLKIALLSAGISGLVLIVFGTFTWLLVYRMRIASVDREIRSLATRHPGLFAGRGNYARLASSLEFTFGTDYTNRVLLALQDPEGRTLYGSPHWPKGLPLETLGIETGQGAGIGTFTNAEAGIATNASAPTDAGTGRAGRGRGPGFGRGGPPTVVFTMAPEFFTARADDSTWRIGVLGNNDLTLVIGLNYAEVQGELDHLRNAFLLTLPLALFLIGLGGWVVAGRALRPLKNIADTAERVTARGLDQRLQDSGESPEADRLIHVLNQMIDRLEKSFRQATRFSADASHELKTPLAVMQGELENALQAAPDGSPEQELYNNLIEETQRLNAITRGLLLLARADSGQLKPALAPVDLSAELEGLLEDARVLAADSNVAFEVNVPAQVHVQADRTMLRTALFNLIHNAIKYNQPDGKISVSLKAVGGQTILTIANTGPGIPAAEQERIFERFYRAGELRSLRTEGSGLGLSLAREIIRAHGGELQLKESRTGWTCFEVRLNHSA